MKSNLLYHRVNPKMVKSLLSDGYLRPRLVHPHKGEFCDKETYDTNSAICFTRDVVYLSRSRPFVVIFDRDKLKKHFSIKPVCLRGLIEQNFSEHYKVSVWQRLIPCYGFECEERVYSQKIPLELAEYVGELPVGHFDYRNPNKIHSKKLKDKDAKK